VRVTNLGDSVRRPTTRPGASAALGSILVHGAVVAATLAVAASAPDIDQFVSYNIELVSMPGPDLGDLVVESPAAPAPEASDPEPQPVVKEPEPARPPKPKPEEPRAEPTPAPPRPTTQARPTPSSGEPSSAGSAEAVNIRIEGLRRDYPVYYNNIILQIKRCFRWTGEGAPETEVLFWIEENGTVSDPRFVRRSGNPTFDYEAIGAIECAGQPGRFGPLPEDFPGGRLPVRFTFRPGNVSGIFR
jgi:outer membrane biosynthesis protein TonB